MNDPLFHEGSLSHFLATREHALVNEISTLDKERFLSTSTEELSTHFVDKYTVAEIALDEPAITVNREDANVDIRYHPNRWVQDKSRPFYVPGTRIEFHIPFKGNASLFRFRTSRYYTVLPRGVIRRGAIVIAYERTPEDLPNIKSAFDKDLELLRDYIGFANDEARRFNSSISDNIIGLLLERQQKFRADRDVVESLGYPVKLQVSVNADDASNDTLQHLPSELPSTAGESSQTEPTWPVGSYEHALTVMSNMSEMMETSPETFKEIKEEALRDHFLVQLNGPYGGQATGETFNCSGKTDILLKRDGEIIFIAECKFWSGPKGLHDAIDQLLRYLRWRDTKAALLIFNRDRKTSTVLRAIPKASKAHPCYVTEEPYESDTGFRYTLCRPDDAEKTLTLTVLVFDIPA